MAKIKGTDYFISKNGNVSNKLGYNICLRERKDGYVVVCLYINKKDKYFYLHRLLAETFIPNPEGKKFVNHINGNKSDNRVENLEWCTASENSKHAFDNGLLSNPVLKGEDHGMSKLSQSDINEIRHRYKTENIYQSTLADIYGVGQSHISRIIRGESWG